MASNQQIEIPESLREMIHDSNKQFAESKAYRRAKLAQPLKAKNWETRTKQRVSLIIHYENPKNAAAFVDMFGEIYGQDKLPYLWVSTARTDSGRPKTLFTR